MADISGFKHYSILYFQHPAYINKSIPGPLTSKNIIAIDLSEDVININGIVISANRWEQSKDQIPQKVLILNAAEIKSNYSQTTADLLEGTGQVFVQKSQLGGGSPMIRGFSANAVLIVVDGVRMNNAIFRSGNLQNVISIDPNNLENAEVIFGPGSVIYGSDALGGVMSFQTKKIDFSTDNKWKVSGTSFIRSSSANKEKTIHAKINLANNKFGSLTSLSYGSYKDLTAGKNANKDYPDFGKRDFKVINSNGIDQIIENEDIYSQSPSAYNQLNLLQKFQYKINSKYALSYTLNYSTTSDIPRYDRLTESNDSLPVSAEWFYGPQQWMMNSLQLSILKGNSLFDQGKITFSAQNIEESRNSRDFGDPVLKTRIEDVTVYSCNIDMEKSLEINKRLYFGLESVYNQVGSTAFSQNRNTGAIGDASTRYPSGGSSYQSLAAYLSYQLETSEKFVLNGGIRANYVGLQAKVEEEDVGFAQFEDFNLNNTSLNGSIGLVYKPTKSWQLDFIASTGFRSPNIDDVGKLFDVSDGIVVVPNPNLKPEYAYNIETSVSKVFGSKAKLNASVFYTYLDNALVRRDFQFNGQDSILFEDSMSKVMALVNTGSADIYGGSVSFMLHFGKGFKFQSALTYNNGKDRENGEPLRHTTPLFTKTSISYTKENFNSSISLKTNAKRDFEDMAPSERAKSHLYTENGTPAWQTLNLNASYKFGKIMAKSGVENIMDVHYRPYSWGISAPGRNFYLSLHIDF